MKKVIEEAIILTDRERKSLQKIDFIDTFSTTNHLNNLEEISNMIFNSNPKWIEKLFTIRNKIAGFLGLQNKLPDDYNENFKVGGYVKFFKIFSISENEVILGADDSHLNFRVFLKNENIKNYNIKVITLVELNNLTGKIYMTIVKPFHKLVVKRLVSNAFNENNK
ncbi:DUF2867 domain-containing protein [Tenacibaculum aiptasiae]|uniref:DUF2867 domain-containing protein n=1 Tax=Tenacibaculum aiptasiae TaxID=426481 RepID=UPI003B5A421A